MGVQRKENLALWKKRDPIARLVKTMESQSMLGVGEIEKLTDGIKLELKTEWQRAVEDPYPVATALLDRVYKKS